VISPAELDDLMHRGWLAVSNVVVDGWIVRLSDGFTQRANSALPVGSPQNLIEALERTELMYQDHGLPPAFQISPAAQPADLDTVLADRGYELRSPTLVQMAGVEAVLRQLPDSDVQVVVSEDPDEEWMGLWRSVDGRGGAAAQRVARRLLTGGPALYALLCDGAGATAVGRIALVDGWGGIYCMAVRPDVRRQGHATAVLRALLEQASSHGVDRVWLQVGADNDPARAFYRRAGFTTASAYHYRSLP